MIKYLFVTHPLFHFDFNGLYLSFSVEIKRKSVSEQTKTSVYWSIHRSINWSVGSSVVSSQDSNATWPKNWLLSLTRNLVTFIHFWHHSAKQKTSIHRQFYVVGNRVFVCFLSDVRTIKSTRSRKIELVDKRDRVVFFTNRKNEHNCSCFIYRSVKFSDVFSLWQIYNLLIYEKP